jgi:gliding motility-associated-like protein
MYTWNNGLGNSNFHVTTTQYSNTYTVSVTDILGCPGDQDTINITVYNIEKDSLTVWRDRDICIGETVNLFANYNGTFGTYSYQWSNGLGSGAGPKSVSPNQITLYQVTVTDQCQTSVSDFVIVNVLQAPVVNIPDIVAQGCGPLIVNFEDQVQGSGSFTYFWSFGDGTTSTLENPIHTFTQAGTYPITVVKTSALGCPGEQTGPSVVTVFPTPVAYGEPNKYLTDITSPTIEFTDLSVGANAIRWDFSAINFSLDSVTSYTYPDTGVYPVLLQATNQYGCMADFAFEVEVVNQSKINVPNAFTPNANGGSGGSYDATSLSTEIFYARLAAVSQFKMAIFNRWGELIFESTNVQVGWDGYYRGELSAQDVYVWKIDVIFEDGSQASEVGNLTLLN